MPIYLIIVAIVVVIIVFSLLITVATRYKRCPSNKVLVVFGRTGSERSAKTIHGGGAFIWPLIQDYTYLSLEPLAIEVDLRGALSKNNIRVSVPSTFTVGISVREELLQNASERLLGLNGAQIAGRAEDIIIGQLRLVIATMTIEEINRDREMFLSSINTNVNEELNKIGLDVINVNVRDITDESGYIEAIGKKAAAEAINQARIDVSEQEKLGASGQARADREREVTVAIEQSQAAQGIKEAERDQQVRLAAISAEVIDGENQAKILVAQHNAALAEGEAKADRERIVQVAMQESEAAQGVKAAERDQRIRLAQLDAEVTEGENTAKAQMALYNADLAEKEAEARRRGEMAQAQAAQAVLEAERETELARLAKEQLAQIETQRKQVEIEAEAEAERLRRIAAGEADAIRARYLAEAEGIKQTLDAKAEGYRALVDAAGDAQGASTLLLIEKMQEIVEIQSQALQNLNIEKITVWENGGGSGNGGGSLKNFMRDFASSLPPIHEIAAQAGVELPAYLGKVEEADLTVEVPKVVEAAE